MKRDDWMQFGGSDIALSGRLSMWESAVRPELLQMRNRPQRLRDWIGARLRHANGND